MKDMIEVIRCKDCDLLEDCVIRRALSDSLMKLPEDGFCSMAIPKPDWERSGEKRSCKTCEFEKRPFTEHCLDCNYYSNYKKREKHDN